MGREPSTKSGEPEVAGGRLECGLQGDEDARTTDIAVATKNVSRVGEGICRDFSLDGFNDIPAAGVRDEAFGIATTGRVKFGNGIRGQRGNGSVKLVFEASPFIDEADFLAVFGLVEGMESRKPELIILIFRAPESGSGTITKKAEADENAGIVADVEGRRGNFDSDGRHEGLGDAAKMPRAVSSMGRAAPQPNPKRSCNRMLFRSPSRSET